MPLCGIGLCLSVWSRAEFSGGVYSGLFGPTGHHAAQGTYLSTLRRAGSRWHMLDADSLSHSIVRFRTTSSDHFRTLRALVANQFPPFPGARIIRSYSRHSWYGFGGMPGWQHHFCARDWHARCNEDRDVRANRESAVPINRFFGKAVWIRKRHQNSPR